MEEKLLPFNISLLVLNKKVISMLGEVKSLAIFEANSKNLDPDGLFSTDIFGPIGSEKRNTTPGYIDIKIKVMHPLIYKYVTALKSMYAGIMERKVYAVWDDKEKDFILSDEENGDTGYDFFLEHADDINFLDNKSDMRESRIEVIKKYGINNTLLDKWLVLPAGLRDYTVNENNQPSEDEINGVYRKLMNLTRLFNNTDLSKNDMIVINPTKIKIQKVLVDIYEHFISLLDGKNKFIEGKWAKRAISFGTRNVITSLPISINNLDDPAPGFNDTTVGIYQYAISISPITKNKLHNVFISRIMNDETTIARLIDPKTMKSKNIEIKPDTKNTWMSYDGLDSILHKMEQDIIKKQYVIIDGCYPALVYNNHKEVKLIFNTDEITDDMKPSHIKPITYLEMLYLAIHDTSKNRYSTFTRYPVAALGGIYTTKVYIKTTVKASKLKFTDNMTTYVLPEYPILSEEVYNSMSPHNSRLGRLVGDFDGDMCSLNTFESDDSNTEVAKLMNSKEYYLAPDGSLTFSSKTDVIDLVLKHLTNI